MEKKFLFFRQILVFNLIRPFPFSERYFERNFGADIDTNKRRMSSRYKNIVNVGQKRLSFTGVVIANAALLLFCLPLSFSADTFIAKTSVLSLKLVLNILFAALMLEKFDVLRFADRRNILKLFYVFFSLFSSSYWTLTCIVMAAFENIV